MRGQHSRWPVPDWRLEWRACGFIGVQNPSGRLVDIQLQMAAAAPSRAAELADRFSTAGRAAQVGAVRWGRSGGTRVLCLRRFRPSRSLFGIAQGSVAHHVNTLAGAAASTRAPTRRLIGQLDISDHAVVDRSHGKDSILTVLAIALRPWSHGTRYAARGVTGQLGVDAGPGSPAVTQAVNAVTAS
jgi:hypothetical protein